MSSLRAKYTPFEVTCCCLVIELEQAAPLVLYKSEDDGMGRQEIHFALKQQSNKMKNCKNLAECILKC